MMPFEKVQHKIDRQSNNGVCCEHHSRKKFMDNYNCKTRQVAEKAEYIIRALMQIVEDMVGCIYLEVKILAQGRRSWRNLSKQ